MIVPIVLFAVFLTACGAAVEPQAEEENPEPVAGSESPTATVEPTEAPTEEPAPVQDSDDEPPFGVEREFSTDFSKHSIPYSEVLSGGPPKDGIPAIDDPKFISVEEAGTWLADVEPIIFVQVGEDARAYPIQILMWHEIVNDTVGELPLTITFCPLCNTAIVFEREVDGQVFDFGTTGRLRNSNLIMYDRQTETWWQQGTGEAIVGEYLGTKLKFYPASIIAWSDFAEAFPEGMVLSRETGFDRSYGRNPYFGYDDINNSPFLFRGETPGQLAAMERVLALDLNDETVAYSYSLLSEVRVIHDQVGGEDIVVFWTAGTASALDSDSVSNGRDVGSASAFSPILDGEKLTFSAQDDGLFEDENTGSLWNILGQSVNGPLEGKTLTQQTAINHFWFDWVAFKPETRVYQP
jgi:hypothetical protein